MAAAARNASCYEGFTHMPGRAIPELPPRRVELRVPSKPASHDGSRPSRDNPIPMPSSTGTYQRFFSRPRQSPFRAFSLGLSLFPQLAKFGLDSLLIFYITQLFYVCAIINCSRHGEWRTNQKRHHIPGAGITLAFFNHRSGGVVYFRV